MHVLTTDDAVPLPCPAVPAFWRDPRLPFIEVRSICDGRGICYGKHAHETFSIGAVTGGASTYLNGKSTQQIGAGTVVLMNPQVMYACNPIADLPWSYHMLYIDVRWLADLQQELGVSSNGEFCPYSAVAADTPGLFFGLNRLYALLTQSDAPALEKHTAAITFFTEMQQMLAPARPLEPLRDDRIKRAADYICDHFSRTLTLEEICLAADLSASYLIRAFQQRYGMTPHAYLTNRRIQFSRAQLRRGHAISEVALEAGFSDQAHLQRVFKRLVAATPGQYRCNASGIS